MLILVMLLKITGWTQEKLADFIGVSRVTLNGWLKETSNMTDSSKKNIADKFEFPVSYFDVDLSQDINLYKVIYSTLTSSWERINRNNSCFFDIYYRNCICFLKRYIGSLSINRNVFRFKIN